AHREIAIGATPRPRAPREDDRARESLQAFCDLIPIHARLLSRRRAIETAVPARARLGIYAYNCFRSNRVIVLHSISGIAARRIGLSHTTRAPLTGLPRRG